MSPAKSLCEVKSNRLFYHILKSLEPMGQIDCQVLTHRILVFKKDFIIFCLLQEDDIYVRADRICEHLETDFYNLLNNKYYKLKKAYLNNNDEFLRIATESYWLAAGLKSN